jgi:hypothetical protein
MFPWVYGFTWDAGNLIFLGLFFTVVCVIAGTVTLALLRSVRDLRRDSVDHLRWEVDFEDLPPQARPCRHELAGDVAHRTCENGFDCRTCTSHERISSMRHTPLETALPVSGLAIPGDRLYHRGHTWVKPEPDGTYLVGLDDFASRVVGATEGVELPAVGKRVHANGTGWTMKKQGTDVRVLAPVDGTVVETGDGKAGWYLRIRAEAADTRHLLTPAEASHWFRREMEHLQMAVGGATLADGGELVRDVAGALPVRTWAGVAGDVFLDP